MKKQITRRAGALVLALAMALTLVPSAWAADGDSDPGTVGVTGVTLNQATLSLTVGDSETLTATIEPDDATNKTVTWTSSDETVATVTDGTVTAVSAGTATITATAGDVSGTCTVTVTEAADTVEVESISLNKGSTTLEAGKTETLTVTFTPENATDKTVDWTSSADTVATVANGVVTAVAKGTATITATTANGKTATCEVTVTESTSSTGTTIKLNPTSLTLTVGGSTGKINAVVDPAGTSVSWSSDRPSVATVTTGGTECVVTPVSAGTATITAKAGDKTATCTVTVNAASTPVDPTPAGITGISFSRANQTFEMKNSPWELSVMTSPAGVEMGPNDSIVWSVTNQTGTSSDEKNWPVITTVPTGANGLTARMEGKIPGNFVVTAKYVKNNTETNITAQLNVSISGILLNTDKVKMLIGENRVLVVDRSYGEAASSAYDTFWTSSDPSVVSVNNNGELLAWKLGTAIITANKNGYTATCEVTVGEDEEVIAFGPYYATTGNPLILIEAADELDTISRRKTGEKNDEGNYISGTGAALNYITNLSVPASQGTLYYNYNSQANTGEGVGAVTRFARQGAGSILSLGKLYFVPRQGFSGTAEISFNGWALNGESFSGSIRVQVTATSTISYSTQTGSPVFFISEDFNTYCRSLTGRDLNYVTFNLPQASQGTLYYNYANANRPGDRVTGSTQYSRSGRTAIESVCFLPNAAFIGRAVITFRGVDTAGQAFTGEIEVTVSDSTAGETANVYISGQRGQPVTLRADLFSDACQSTIRDTLSYVTFKLPAYNEGTLFYNYQNAGSPGARVDAGTRYYYSGVPGINGITFVPASNSTGRVAVTYTGHGVGGATFTGTVYISIGDTERATVRYFVPKNGVITFNAADFSSAAVLEMGVSMEYVTFRVPDAMPVGALYYDYQGDWYYNNGVYSSFEYYRSPKESYQGRIDLITFHAGASAGSVTIPYTAYSAADGAGKRESFTGSVIIQVGSPTPEDVKLTANVGDQLWLPSDRLAAVCTPVMDKSLAYIEITGLPPASEGRLYSGYLGFNTGAEVKRGDRFYCMGAPGIDQVSFVPHGGFTGEVEITYVGFSSDGQEQLSGRILVTVTNSDKSRYFNDMTSHFWAIDAVDFLYRNNTVMGIGDDRFNPTGSISKGDFALMLVRAFKFTGDSSVRYLDVPEGTYYTEAISIASQKGVAGGSNGYFHPLEALSRQDAMLMIYNALKADGRLLTNGLAANLDGYHDEKQISAEAREAVGCLVQMGIVKGDGNGYLNPQARLNRAETAVLLHAVMTL